jgi:hypothetical protein
MDTTIKMEHLSELLHELTTDHSLIDLYPKNKMNCEIMLLYFNGLFSCPTGHALTSAIHGTMSMLIPCKK